MSEPDPSEVALSSISVPSQSSSMRLLLRRFSSVTENWALSDQALVSGANFLTNVMLARALGPSGFGLYALCWTWVLLMSSLQMAAIVSPMMSIGPKQALELRPSYYGAITLQAVCLAAAAAACVFAGVLGCAAWKPAWHAGPLALPLAAATAAYMFQDFVRRYFFSIGRSHLAMACDGLSYLTQLPLLWLFAWRRELTLAGALWIIALTSLFSVLVSFYWLEDMCFRLAAVRSVAIRHWKVVRWLAPSALLQWASLNFFIVSAPVYYGAAAAGALRACLNVVAIAHIWFLGLDNVLPAEAAHQLHAHGVDASMSYLKKMFVRWGLVTLGFMLIIAVAPAFWLHLLYGSRYMRYGSLLRLYSLLYVLIFVSGPLRAGLQAIEYTAPLLWSYAAMAAFAAVMAAPMAKALGLPGVMLGLMATQVLFQAILVGALLARTKRMRSQEELAHPWREHALETLR